MLVYLVLQFYYGFRDSSSNDSHPFPSKKENRRMSTTWSESKAKWTEKGTQMLHTRIFNKHVVGDKKLHMLEKAGL